MSAANEIPHGTSPFRTSAGISLSGTHSIFAAVLEPFRVQDLHVVEVDAHLLRLVHPPRSVHSPLRHAQALARAVRITRCAEPSG